MTFVMLFCFICNFQPVCKYVKIFTSAKKGICKMAFVKVDNLIKNYGSFCAVDSLSFEVEQGEIFGLLGPNGAGKSTTINIITTLDEQNSGTVTVNGYDTVKQRAEVRKIIGTVPQDIALYPFLSAIENVKFFASLYGLKGKELEESAMRALEFTGLSEHAKLKAKKMSGGMKRRLNIACGIAHHPKLIVMDEPTVGVDAQSREHILNAITLLRDKGATVIYTSHYMHEVEEICDRMAIIDHGRLVAQGTEKELVSMITDSKTITVTTRFPHGFDHNGFTEQLKLLPDVNSVRCEDNTVRLDVRLTSSDFSYIIDEIKKFSLPLNAVQSTVPNLDAVFLALTGHELR